MEGSKGCPVPLAIASYIEANPRSSDLQVAKELGVSHPTVADVRENARNCKNFNFEQVDSNRPIERAKAAARANPEASEKKIAELAEVSPRNMVVNLPPCSGPATSAASRIANIVLTARSSVRSRQRLRPDSPTASVPSWRAGRSGSRIHLRGTWSRPNGERCRWVVGCR